MNVAELQQHVRSMSQFLQAAGGSAGVVSDLDYLGQCLEPFRAHKLRVFAEFLVRAEAYARGEVPIGKKPAAPRKPAAPKKPAQDPEQARRAAEHLFDLYNRAADPAVTAEAIEAAVEGLKPLKKADLDALAQRMEVGRMPRSISDATKAIRQKVLDRKGMIDRVHS